MNVIISAKQTATILLLKIRGSVLLMCMYVLTFSKFWIKNYWTDLADFLSWKQFGRVFKGESILFYPIYLKRLFIMASSSGNCLVAKRTGAVARPNSRSAAAGLPSWSADETKSSRSSTSWNPIPRCLPYRKAFWHSDWLAPSHKIDGMKQALR